MTEEADSDQTLKLVSDRALTSPPGENCQAVCGRHWMLALAICMNLLVVFGMSLVNFETGSQDSGEFQPCWPQCSKWGCVSGDYGAKPEALRLG